MMDSKAKNDYLGEKAMEKRVADWLEKMSVAALAVGIFQGQMLGVLVSTIFLGLSLWLTYRMEKKQ
jgi:hypothetical protein